MYNVILRCVHATIVAVAAIGITYSESVCLWPCVSRMQCAYTILSSVACLALPYFPPLSRKWHNFFGGKKLNIKCVFWFSLQLLSEIFLTLRRTERDTIKMYIGFHGKYPLFLSDFNETWIFLTDFWKYSNIKPHENPSSGSRVVPCAQMDRHAKANRQFFAILQTRLKTCQLHIVYDEQGRNCMDKIHRVQDKGQ